MKCNHCRKTVPEVSLSCPYCKQLIDPNQKLEVDFGDLGSTDYDKKFDIKSFIQDEPDPVKKNKKVGILVGVGIMFIVIAIFLVVVVFFSPDKGTSSNILYHETVNTLFEYIYDNYTNSSAMKQGTFELDIKVNEDEYQFYGDYGLDVNNKIVNISSNMEDPRKSEGAIIIDTSLLNIDFYLKENNLYLLSEKLHSVDEYILFPIDDETGLLATKKYDLTSLLSGVQDALLAALNEVSFQVSDEVIIHRGEEIELEKHAIVFDGKTSESFGVNFLNTLLEDSNFINEYARIQGSTSSEVRRIIENYITTIEYKYSDSDEQTGEIAIYYKSGKVYRIEANLNEKQVYQIDIGDTKYYFNYYKDGKSLYSATLVAQRSEKNDLLIKDYEITFDSDKYVIDIQLDLKQVENPKVKKIEVEKYINIRDFKDSDYDKLKRNLDDYFYDVSWVDNLDDIFKEKCNPDLVCQCEMGLDYCNCTYDNKIIKCPVESVSKPISSPDNVTTTTASN